MPGKTLNVDGKPIMCRRGLHASELISDALTFATGPILCRVAVWGDVEHGIDMLAGKHRHVIWQIDATNILWSFACYCSEFALEQELAHGRDVDERSYAAIAARRNWLAGHNVDLNAA